MLMQGLAILRPTPEAPFGPEAEGTNPLCAPFRIQMPATVAIVGNGPLTEPQRREIEACDLVVRYRVFFTLRLRKRSVTICCCMFIPEGPCYPSEHLEDEDNDT
jgi:hypothetical protein